MRINLVQDTWNWLRSPEETAGGTGSATPAVTVESQSSQDSAPAKTEESGRDANPLFETDFGVVDDAFISELEEGQEGSEEEPKSLVPTGKEPDKPVVAKPGEEKPAAAAPADPITKPGEETKAPEKPGEGKQAEAAAAEPAQPQSFTDVLIAAEKNVVPELAKLYSIPEELAKSFTAEQQPALKQLAGMVHFNVLRAAAAMVENLVPGMIANYQAATKSQDEGQTEFFTAWPQLKAEHIPTIKKYGQLWVQANPKGTRAEYIKAVGLMASSELGLLTAAPATVPAANGAEVKPKSVEVPFAPANVTGSQRAPVPASGGAGVDWAGLSDQLGNDET